MSYDNWDDGFTESEIEAGVPALVHGGEEYEDDYDIEKDLEKDLEKIHIEEQNKKLSILDYYLDQDNTIVSDFYLLRLKQNFLNKMIECKYFKDIYLLFKEELNKHYINKLALTYFKEEKLDINFLDLVKSKDCVEKLISNVLFKHAQIPFKSSIKESFQSEVEKILLMHDTPYNRTNRIQQLIHKSVNDYYCTLTHLPFEPAIVKRNLMRCEKLKQTYLPRAHLLLPSDIMKKTLSLTRLNIYILDIMNKDSRTLRTLSEMSDSQASTESLNPTDSRLSKKKKYFCRWKVKHMKSFTSILGNNNPLRAVEIFNILSDQILDNLDEPSFDKTLLTGETGFGMLTAKISMQEFASLHPKSFKRLLNVIANYYIETIKEVKPQNLKTKHNAILDDGIDLF
jgi:hypothetical protein